MANGHSITDLAGDGRGKLAVLAAVTLITASGVSFLITNEGRNYTDARIAAAITVNQMVSDDRYRTLLADLARIERELKEHDEEFRRVWAEMAKRIDREAMLEGHRRLEAIETDIENLQRRVYGRFENERNP